MRRWESYRIGFAAVSFVGYTSRQAQPDLRLLTPGEISGRLADAEFSEAAAVLEMIAQSPREREMYEARLKFERDQTWHQYHFLSFSAAGTASSSIAFLTSSGSRALYRASGVPEIFVRNSECVPGGKVNI